MRATLLVLSLVLITLSVALEVTGGFSTTVFGTRLSARSPGTAAVGAVIAAGLWFISAWPSRRVAADLAALAERIDTRAGAIVTTIAALAAAVAVRFGTFSATGADPSGYFSEAAMLSSRALSRVEPLAAIADWPDAAATLAPLGWRAASDGLQVPTYAVGLPLLMAIPHALGGALGASLVVSASAALTVWFGGRLAMALAGGAAGVIAAVWLATMPIALFESIQPMSDVPVTAAWLACWYLIAKAAEPPRELQASATPLAETAKKGTVPFLAVFAGMAVSAGLAAALAVLIRPNLAPLAVVPALFLLCAPRIAEPTFRATGAGEQPTFRATGAGAALKRRALGAGAFAVPVAIAGAAIAYLQWRWFGSPFRSGYGTAEEIYSMSNLGPNAALYLRWLLDTHGPWLLAAPLALLVVRAPLLRWMLAFAVLVCLAYFSYAQFENWPYLRFLLPAMAVAAIVLSALAATLIAKLPPAARVPVLLVVLLGLAGSQVASARELEVFRLAARQSRALVAGRYLGALLRPDAVVITGEQSGAMRYYTNRSIVRWDVLAPSALKAAEQRLAGHDLWVVLDDWEAPLVRGKFAGTTAAAGLDWPPVMDAGPESRLQAWRVTDRERFMRGDRVITDRLR